MLFEIYITPKLKDIELIRKHLMFFLKYKNYLSKHQIIIYSLYNKEDLINKKYQKLNIEFCLIRNTTTDIKTLWINNIEKYLNQDWIIHYELENRLMEFDFIKMVFKKLKNTFVKKNHIVYTNLFCIDQDLLLRFINSENKILTSDFIVSNTHNFYFLKYMNIISKNEFGQNIYI